MVTAASREVLDELLDQAGLPSAASVTPSADRGFDNEITIVTLEDGCRVVLRRFREPRPPECVRARFLAAHGIPAPALLAADERASLVEFVSGQVLGDLIETRRDTAQVWRLVGDAYRRVHAVRFPSGLTAEVLDPDRFVLTAVDPVAQLHTLIDEAEPGLRRLLPECTSQLPALRERVQAAAPALRAAPAALGHGDINMWNILVASGRTTLIDWDCPRVADPAMEVALLDKHASLFNRTGLPSSFFDGYGHPPTQPNTAVHRVVQTLQWATSSDWAEIETDPAVSEELEQRARSWLPILLDYLRELPAHIHRLRVLTGA